MEDKNITTQKRRVDEFKKIVDKIVSQFVDKNMDYGGSVFETYEEYGEEAFLIRLTDKLNRLKKIEDSGKVEVSSESFEDTLEDLATYAIINLVALHENDQDKAVTSDATN